VAAARGDGGGGGVRERERESRELGVAREANRDPILSLHVSNPEFPI